MAKISGIPTSVSIDDGAGSPQVITNDVTEISWSSPNVLEDITGLDKVAVERLHLLGDFTGELTGWFNTASNMSHAVFKTIWSSTIASRTLAIGLPGATLTAEVLLSDYSMSVNDGKVVWKVPFALANGAYPVWS